MCTYATGKGHEKSQGLIRVSVPGYVMVSILFDDPDKREFLAFYPVAAKAHGIKRNCQKL